VPNLLLTDKAQGFVKEGLVFHQLRKAWEKTFGDGNECLLLVWR
jgi:hypothetical protein